MFIEKTMNDRWLSNSWLAWDEPGGHAVLVDTGGPTDPIVATIERERLTLTHLLCTHHHLDHVTHNDEYAARFGAPVCGHPAELDLFGKLDVELLDGAEVESGSMRIRALHIPGHTVGQLAFVINEERVFTGDTLFRRSVGGTRGPGHTTFEDLRHSIMGILMDLPKEMPAHPGHVDETTIGDEWEHNPFVRAWRGLTEPEGARCTAFGAPATILLDAEDYDGGRKCWVRFDERDKLDLVPGSAVKRTA